MTPRQNNTASLELSERGGDSGGECSSKAWGVPPALPKSVVVSPEKNILLLYTVGILCLGALALISQTGLSFLSCGWKSATGIPCGGCGGTRSLLLILSGDFKAAFVMNPLVTVGFLLSSLLFAYAGAVVYGRMKPIRVRISQGVLVVLSLALAAAVLLNWVYLLTSHR